MKIGQYRILIFKSVLELLFHFFVCLLFSSVLFVCYFFSFFLVYLFVCLFVCLFICLFVCLWTQKRREVSVHCLGHAYYTTQALICIPLQLMISMMALVVMVMMMTMIVLTMAVLMAMMCFPLCITDIFYNISRAQFDCQWHTGDMYFLCGIFLGQFWIVLM